MKKLHLGNIENWEVLHYVNRTILKSDLQYMSGDQRIYLLYRVQVEPMTKKGHYKAIG